MKEWLIVLVFLCLTSCFYYQIHQDLKESREDIMEIQKQIDFTVCSNFRQDDLEEQN